MSASITDALAETQADIEEHLDALDEAIVRIEGDTENIREQFVVNGIQEIREKFESLKGITEEL